MTQELTQEQKREKLLALLAKVTGPLLIATSTMTEEQLTEISDAIQAALKEIRALGDVPSIVPI